MFSRILVPVDFSPCSHAATEYAAVLAERLGATLHLLHVWDPPPMLHGTEELHFFVRTEVGRQMKEYLQEVEQQIGVPVRGRLETGEPGEVIVSLAQEDGYDLIVMGIHGQGGKLARFIRGSVAQTVVRRAHCPVLTIHAGELPDRPQPGAGLAESSP